MAPDAFGGKPAAVPASDATLGCGDVIDEHAEAGCIPTDSQLPGGPPEGPQLSPYAYHEPTMPSVASSM
jgi:hypothetical protein